MSGLQPEGIDLVTLRARVQEMSDSELLSFGRVMHNMVYPRMHGPKGKPTVSAFSIQLDEARAEWRRRHSKDSSMWELSITSEQ